MPRDHIHLFRRVQIVPHQVIVHSLCLINFVVCSHKPGTLKSQTTNHKSQIRVNQITLHYITLRQNETELEHNLVTKKIEKRES